MPAWLCIHKQTKKKLILAEEEAFKLDKRIWELQVWVATSGHERSGITKGTPTPIVIENSIANIKCPTCGTYSHPVIKDTICKRPKHVRFCDLI